MSRTVPRNDPISRLNDMHKRLASLERNTGAAIISADAVFDITASSTTFSAPDGSPFLNALVPTNGDVLLTLSSTITTAAAGDEGTVGVAVDGLDGIPLLVAGGASTALTVPASVTIAASALGLALTPGPHTFGVQVRSSVSGHNRDVFLDVSGRAAAVSTEPMNDAAWEAGSSDKGATKFTQLVSTRL